MEKTTKIVDIDIPFARRVEICFQWVSAALPALMLAYILLRALDEMIAIIL